MLSFLEGPDNYRLVLNGDLPGGKFQSFRNSAPGVMKDRAENPVLSVFAFGCFEKKLALGVGKIKPLAVFIEKGHFREKISHIIT
ncbi:MAG: hypothetical protein MUO63_13050 [Desulfobulbaceae bacterium]|nr:hypothetical protein [Desulfobulbaceae bacterium]